MAVDRTLRGVGPSTPHDTPASAPGPVEGATPSSGPDDATRTGERRPHSDAIVLGPGAILEQRYRLEERIGRGGMGEVWRGTHLVLGRAIAIKLLIPDPRAESTRADRMLREARLVGRIAHPHVVEILDTGETPSGLPFLVMALVDGAPLSSQLRRGALRPEHALAITEQLADALQAAHEVGVLHRDLKPANVLVRGLDGASPHCTLIDFGIAKTTEWGPRESTLTNTGVVYGTPAYMSPEQARGQALDVRSDVYALGVLLFEMLTGARPFRAPTPAELLYLQLFVPPPLPSMVRPEQTIAPGLDAIVRRCLYKDREHRFADMAALRAALQAVRDGVELPLPEIDRPAVPLEVQRRHTQVTFATVPPAITAIAAPQPRESARRAPPTGPLVAIAAVVIVLAIASAAWLLRPVAGELAPPGADDTTPATTQAPTPPPVIESAGSVAPPSAAVQPFTPAASSSPTALPAPLREPTTEAAGAGARNTARPRVRREAPRTRTPVDPVPRSTPAPSEPAAPAQPPAPRLPDADGIIR